MSTTPTFANLDELCSYLNSHHAIDAEAAGLKLSMLPTFGGEDPESTESVWSWDSDRLMVLSDSVESSFRLVLRADHSDDLYASLVEIADSEEQIPAIARERAVLCLNASPLPGSLASDGQLVIDEHYQVWTASQWAREMRELERYAACDAREEARG